MHSEDLSVSWLSQRLTRAAGHRTLYFLVHLTGSLVCVYHTRLLNKPKQRDIHGPTASQGSLTHSASLADFSHDVLERLWVAVGVLTHSLWLWWDELQDAASWLSMCVPEFGICGHVSFTRSRAPLSKHRIKWSTWPQASVYPQDSIPKTAGEKSWNEKMSRERDTIHKYIQICHSFTLKEVNNIIPRAVTIISATVDSWMFVIWNLLWAT